MKAPVPPPSNRKTTLSGSTLGSVITPQISLPRPLSPPKRGSQQGELKEPPWQSPSVGEITSGAGSPYFPLTAIYYGMDQDSSLSSATAQENQYNKPMFRIWSRTIARVRLHWLFLDRFATASTASLNCLWLWKSTLAQPGVPSTTMFSVGRSNNETFSL